MRAPGTRLHTAMLAATAFAGLVAGHLLDYLVAIPDPADRNDILALTGHSYLPSLTVLAMAIGAVAGCVALALGVVRGRRAAGTGLGLGAVLPVALAQAGSFVALETAERLSAGISLHHLTDGVILAGVGLQLMVGALAALVLVLLERIGRRVGALSRRRRAPAPAGSRVGLLERLIILDRRLLGSGPIRAPPLFLPA